MPSLNTYHLTSVSLTLDVGYLFMSAPAKHICCSFCLRFKELDLLGRVPDELWMVVCDIVQETGSKTLSFPKKNKCKKAKWLSEEALQIAEKRREAKGKRAKERYTQLNAEFQRIARRDKKAFLSEQCKEIEENNRMGKT